MNDPLTKADERQFKPTVYRLPLVSTKISGEQKLRRVCVKSADIRMTRGKGVAFFEIQLRPDEVYQTENRTGSCIEEKANNPTLYLAHGWLER